MSGLYKMVCSNCDTVEHFTSVPLEWRCDACDTMNGYSNKELVRKSNDAGENTEISVKETLAERGTRYGEFANHAKLSQHMKMLFNKHVLEHGQPDEFTDTISESIEMIFHKLARIANGDPQYDDNFRDIAGYAQLVVDELQKTGNK